jgi:hypothetical protein
MNDLPQPANWQNGRVLLAIGCLLAVAAAAFGAIQTAISIGSEQYIAAWITAGLTTLFTGMLVILGIKRIRRDTLRGEFDQDGTVLRPDPAGRWLFVFLFSCLIPTTALYLAYVPRGVVQLPFVGSGRGFVSTFYMGCLLVLSIIGLITLIRRGGSTYVRIAETSLEYADLSRTRVWKWDDITDVTDATPKKNRRHPIVFTMSNADPVVIPNAGGWAPDGAALYWMVRHYLLHPENRSELNTGRALERLQHKDFDPE